MSDTLAAYHAFLASKARTVPPSGFEPTDLPACLFPYQQDLVRWACRRGKAALFVSTGLGKSPMQLAWAHQVVNYTGGSVLILAPLAVAAQLVREGQKFGLPCKQLASQEEVTSPGVYVTNYDKREKFDLPSFQGVVLEESSIIKNHGGATRQAMVEGLRRVPFRLACTATPAPNDHEELGNHAEVLGICTRVEMLSEFFYHDGGKTQDWALKHHARAQFWKWVCSWAAVVRDPTDLGYDGSSHVLPPLHIHEHIVRDESGFAKERGLLFSVDVLSLNDARSARKATMAARIAKAAELVSAEPDEQWLIWGELNGECDLAETTIPASVQVSGDDDEHVKEERLIGFVNGSVKRLISKQKIAGWGLNLQCCARMIFLGAGFSFEGWYQAIRRCYRFGQKRPVHVHVITSDIEESVLKVLKVKQAKAEEMAEQMSAYTRQYVQSSVLSLARETNDYNPQVPMTIPSWLVSEP